MNRRDLLKKIPFFAAIPFVRIPHDDEQERVRKIMRHLAENDNSSFRLLEQPKLPTEVLNQIAESQKRAEAVSGQYEPLGFEWTAHADPTQGYAKYAYKYKKNNIVHEDIIWPDSRLMR